jgi:hypothetical protein
LKVSYEFTRDDLWKYGKHVTLSIPKFRRKIIFNVLMIPILVCAFGYTRKFSIGTYISYGLGLTAAYIYVLNAVLKGKFVKANSGKEGPLGKHTIDIGINGVKENYPTREDSHSWREITKVVQDKKYIYIHWSDNAAHSIPKRAFTKTEDAEFFYNAAIKHLNSVEKKEIK